MQPLQNLDLLDLELTAGLRGDFDEAWRIAELLRLERPDDPRAKFNRAWHLMQRGDLLGGFEHIEYGRQLGVFGSPELKTRKPRWRGEESLVGKTVLLRGEGGFGDEIINARFAENLARLGARVVYACNPGLMSLMSGVPGVAQAVPHAAVEANAVEFDFWVPSMSAPLALKLTYAGLSGKPYITPGPGFVAKWKSKITGPGLKVGIRWSGNPKFEHEQYRRFPTEPLISLSQLPGVTLYSLQRDNDLRDLPEEVVDLQHELLTWDDAAGAIANLDLVITSCTSVAHLAASMGKETWVIVPLLSYQVWALPGDITPWYESVRLFRQEIFGNWDAPLARVRETLAGRLGILSRSHPKSQTPLSWNGAPAPSAEVKPPQRGEFPGLVVAPYPASFKKETPAHSLAASPSPAVIHFVAGMPRSGSTALMSLLAQNSRIYSAPISGLAGVFAGVYANWDGGDFHKELPNPEAKRRVLQAILERYHKTERPLILDKERSWIAHIALLEDVLDRPIKLILPVRPIPEILASFEALRLREPIEYTGADAALGQSSTIASRAEYFMDAKGPLGMALNATGDAVHMGYLNRLLFVDYNRLMAAPKTQIKRIYDFLEEPYFEHDFGNIRQVAQGDWRAHKFPGLHDIRGEFKKDSPSARDMLGPYVFDRYNAPEPWQSWI